MQLLDKYLSYWPVLAASLVFLILGLWWRLSAAKAMELAPKPVGWVKNYRSGGFPFRREILGNPKLRWFALLLILLLAAAFAVGRVANIGMIYDGNPDLLLRSRYALLLVLLWSIGAGAVYCLLITLFDSLWVAVPGALLFAASASQGHAECCFLAISLLFLLLWLRAEKPGFPAELLYLCALLSLAPLLSLRPVLIWLVPCFLIVHWYKLAFQRRAQRLSGGSLFLSLLLALLCWVITVVVAVALLRFRMTGFSVRYMLRYFRLRQLQQTAQFLLSALGKELLSVPTPGMTLDLMVDAPLLGFGLWGCCSAWILARKRRDARGVFALVVLAVLLLIWLLTQTYVLTLGLILTTACVLRDADLGKKHAPVVLLTAAGICWYVVIQIAAWYLPLTPGLVERLI